MFALAAAAALAGGTAWTLARAARAEAGWEARHPPLGERVAVEGRRIHVRVTGRAAGSAPDLVLIHGANGHLRDFAPALTRPLEAEFRVLAVDRPGLGWSGTRGRADDDPREQARILRRALAGFGLHRPIVLGHSYGGAVALAWALDDPGTAALVILAGTTHPWPGDFAPWYRAYGGPLGWPARTAIAAFARDRQARRLIRAVFAPDPVPDGYLEAFGPGLSMRRAVQAASTRQVCTLKGYLARMSRDYPALTLPIEAVHGTADGIVWPRIHAERLARDVASARLTLLEGVGHMPHHARPQAVLAAIRRAAARAGLANRP